MHVVFSVGWLGAVIGSMALAVAGIASEDPQVVRGAYLMLELTGWFVLVPFAIGSLLSGLLQALGTKWGLFRHYWVIAKLLINVFATIVLLMYTQTLGHLADIARETSGGAGVLQGPTVVLHAAGALLLLLAATGLAVYKPRGLTPYGRRKLSQP